MNKKNTSAIILLVLSIQLAQSLSYTIPLDYSDKTSPLFTSQFGIGTQQTLINFKINLNGKNSIVSSQCDNCIFAKQKFNCVDDTQCKAQDTITTQTDGTKTKQTTVLFDKAYSTQTKTTMDFDMIVDTTSNQYPNQEGQLSMEKLSTYLENPIAYFYLQNPGLEVSKPYPSQINFGLRNETLADGKNKLLAAPTAKTDKLEMTIKEMSIQGKKFIDERVVFNIDMDSSYISLPKKVYNKFVTILQTEMTKTPIQLLQDSIIINDIIKLDEITFEALDYVNSNEEFEIHPINFVRKNRDLTYEIMVKVSKDDTYSIGLPLFYEYYVLINFEKYQIGLVEKETNSGLISKFSLVSLLFALIFFLF